MGRHRKQYTEEELLELERKKYRYTLERSKERGVTNKAKHSRIVYDAIKYDVGTMDRISLVTMYISCTISILWNTDEALFRKLRDDIGRAINDWLCNQDTWDKKNRIYVFNVPEKNSSYVGSFRNVDFELHVRRVKEPVSYMNSVNGLMPLVETITDTIKKSCDEAGLVLAHRPSTAGGVRLKDYVKTLTNASSPSATEPDAGGSSTVEV